MMDFELTFELADDASNFEETTSRLIAIAERTKSSIGGGSDNHQGEFYVDASSRFGQSHLLEMVSILLPTTTNLTISNVKPAHKSRRCPTPLSSNKRSNGTGNSAGRTISPRPSRKQRVKV